ncbi:MAG: CBS domain-containing protein [Pirellulaceae bacterium]|nr:CBS domain-containing protein [Pirellulaceae bacterium]
MKKHAPHVRDYMTHLPVEAERCETANDGIEIMRRHSIRHIPVMNGSHLVGIVSQRDLLEARVRLGDDFASTSLDQICTTDVLTVSPVDPIDDVARKMLARDAHSAVVVDRGFVVGIFTTSDALRFIANVFGQANS